MKHGAFVDQLDDAKIVAAIAAAEKRTSGQLRVFISRKKCPDGLGTATRQFKALKMDQTRQHNAVLIFVAPQSQTFAVMGDSAVHEKCGEEFWGAVRDEMTGFLKEARYTEAILHGIVRAGELLAVHFPPGENAAGDELPNDVSRD